MLASLATTLDYQEPDFGLMQLGVRFYDSQTGGFTQRDIVESDAQTSYAYADAEATTMVDPTGMAGYCPGQMRDRCVSLRKGMKTAQTP